MQRMFAPGTRVTFNHKTWEPRYGTVVEPMFPDSNTVQWDDREWNPHPISYRMGEVRQATAEPSN